MNTNPHTCPHLNLVYEKVAGGDPFIRCDDCMTTWDADEPISDTIEEWVEHHGPLNPDNEPTSEHMQWRKDNDTCMDQS